MTLDFPGYEIVCEIGRGGMATVYRARQMMLDREVALKVLSPTLASDASNAQRFLQEARMLASLEHPHVVPVYDVGVTPDGSHYFSMQLLENGDFNVHLQRGVSEAELVRVISAVADALTYAHARGYVHRDVTPSNILFDQDDKPRLTDFGIARAMALTSRITASGLSVGTSHYMSPEQARGGEVDPRSDIYSLGVVCYEALTGHTPFRGDDSFAVAYAHVYEPVPPLPAGLAKWQPLIDRCLAKNPEDRFQDCAAFTNALRRVAFSSRPGNDAKPARQAGSDRYEGHAALRRVRDDVPTVPAGRRAEEGGSDPASPDAGAAGRPQHEEAREGATMRRWSGPLLGMAGLLAAVVMVVSWQAWRGGSHAPRATGVGAEMAGAMRAPASIQVGVERASPGVDDMTAGMDAAVQDAAAQTVLDPVPILLEQAALDLAERRYSSPPGNNALDRYRLVRRIEPGNADARAGIERVVATYLRLADEFTGDEDPALWSGYLQRAVELAERFDVPAVAAEARQRRQERLEQLLSQAGAAMAGWDRERAVLLYQRAKMLQPADAAIETALAQARRIGQDGFVFRDRAEGRDGPEMIVVNGLAFSRAPITVAEFRQYWDASGAGRFGAALPSCRDRESAFRSSRRRSFLDPGFSQGDGHPVVCINAAMADDYVRWLARGTGRAYRLPSVAELRAAGVGAAEDCAAANLRDAAFRAAFGGRAENHACDDGYATTSPVGAFGPAANGLRDAGGNVREWSEDCAGNACSERIAVGAGWASGPGESLERGFQAEAGFNTIGFRVARSIP